MQRSENICSYSGAFATQEIVLWKNHTEIEKPGKVAGFSRGEAHAREVHWAARQTGDGVRKKAPSRGTQAGDENWRGRPSYEPGLRGRRRVTPFSPYFPENSPQPPGVTQIIDQPRCEIDFTNATWCLSPRMRTRVSPTAVTSQHATRPSGLGDRSRLEGLDEKRREKVQVTASDGHVFLVRGLWFVSVSCDLSPNRPPHRTFSELWRFFPEKLVRSPSLKRVDSVHFDHCLVSNSLVSFCAVYYSYS